MAPIIQNEKRTIEVLATFGVNRRFRLQIGGGERLNSGKGAPSGNIS